MKPGREIRFFLLLATKAGRHYKNIMIAAIAPPAKFSLFNGSDASPVLSTGDRRILDFCLFEKFFKLAKSTGMKADIQKKHL